MSHYTPDLCLYHANCDDGFTAAWAVWKRWPDCEFRAAQYGDLPPEDVAGKHVLIVDFSWPQQSLEQIAETAATVLVLDHHKTAQAAQELIKKMIVKLARADAGGCQIITPAQMRQVIAWAEGLA